MTRRLICAAASMLAAFSVWAQEQRLDSLFLNNGDVISCRITEISSSEIKYVYPGETLVNVLSTIQVRQAQLASGRIVKGRAIEPVLSEDDWNKVIVTNDGSLADGLKFVKTIKAESSVWRSTKESESDKAYVELKKEAARNHCHLVVLVGGLTRSPNYWTGQNDMELRANIYTYPFIGVYDMADWEAWRERVIKKPDGSYMRSGWKRYDMLLKMIKEMNPENTTRERVKEITDKLKIYKQVRDSFLLNSEDGERFAFAYGKLKKALDRKMEKLYIQN